MGKAYENDDYLLEGKPENHNEKSQQTGLLSR
jgi:hypothetical protein